MQSTAAKPAPNTEFILRSLIALPWLARSSRGRTRDDSYLDILVLDNHIIPRGLS